MTNADDYDKQSYRLCAILSASYYIVFFFFRFSIIHLILSFNSFDYRTYRLRWPNKLVHHYHIIYSFVSSMKQEEEEKKAALTGSALFVFIALTADYCVNGIVV